MEMIEVETLATDQNNGIAADDTNKLNTVISDPNDETIAHYTKDEAEPTVERVKFERKENVKADESVEKKLLPIPDGGWGWVVVVSAFIVFACISGSSLSIYLLYENFKRYFNASWSMVVLIGSLFTATPLLAGPVLSVLVDHYGCRTMTIIAGLLSTCGFLLAAFSNSIAMLCLTCGIISGLAMGILYVTAVVSVVFWFDKRRNVAVSLASCGSAFGTFIYSPLTKYFQEFYGWRNTIVLLSGTLLNMCVCGLLMRNPEWTDIKQTREGKLSKTRSKRPSSGGLISSISLGEESVFFDAEELKALLQSGNSPEYILATLVSSIAEAEELEATTQINDEQTNKLMHSAIHLPTFVQKNDKVPPEVIQKLMENKRIYNIIMHHYPDLIARSKSQVNIRQTTKTIIDYKIFLFNLSVLILSMASSTPYMFLHLAMTMSNVRGGELMLIIINITKFIGIIVLGWAGDRPWVNETKTYAGCIIICGLCVAVYPLIIIHFGLVTIVSAIFGFCIASSYSYTPTVMLKLMPMDQFTTAYGVLLFFRGVGSLFGPPIMGYMYDLSRSYDWILYISGLMLVISGICLSVIAFKEDAQPCGAAPLPEEAEEARSEEELSEV